MKIYFHLGIHTHAYICHEMAKYWKKKYGWNQYAGITIIKENKHHEYLVNQTDIDYSFIDVVDKIERDALDFDVPEGRIEEWEKKLGVSLWQLVLADRNLGHWFVKGGDLVKTDIMNEASHDYVQRLVCCYLDLFEKRLAEFSPDFVFFPSSTGAALHSLAFAKVCKLMGVPYYMVSSARIYDWHFIVENNHFGRSFLIEEKYNKAKVKSNYEGSQSHDIKEYIGSFQGGESVRPEWHGRVGGRINKIRTQSFVVFYSQIVRDTVSAGLRFFRHRDKNKRHLRHKHKFSNLFYSVKQRLSIRFFNEKKYESSNVKKDKYIFFPLHLNPEASTMVHAPNFVDQSYLVDLIVKNIPLDCKLYVKEHRSMIGRRPSGFYKSMSENPNVKLISPMEDSHFLIRHSALTTVITGTAGWEALMIGVPVLMFGQCFFSEFGLAEKQTDIENLGITINNMIYAGFDVEERRKNINCLLPIIKNNTFSMPSNFFFGLVCSPSDIGESELLLIENICTQIEGLLKPK